MDKSVDKLSPSVNWVNAGERLVDKLSTFVNWVNAGEYRHTRWMLPEGVANQVHRIVHENLLEKTKHEPKFRPSNMYRPWVVQVLDYWYPHMLKSLMLDKVRFMDGLWWEFEAYLLLLKFSHDYELGWIVQNQLEFDYAPNPEIAQFGIKGHVDVVITDPSTNESLCVELKALSPGLIKNFRDGYVQYDIFGYKTQISLYAVCTGMPVCFLLKDKESSKVSVATIADKDIERIVENTNTGIHKVMGLKYRDVRSLINDPFFAPPLPRAEVSKGQETGNYLLPQSMADSIWWTVFYEVVGQNKAGTPYVLLRDTNEVIYMLEKLNNAPS